MHKLKSRWRTSVVAPHVGAWIEMKLSDCLKNELGGVAPHVGAWIEMGKVKYPIYKTKSHLT